MSNRVVFFISAFMAYHVYQQVPGNGDLLYIWYGQKIGDGLKRHPRLKNPISYEKL
jgi:hypothetical protein